MVVLFIFTFDQNIIDHRFLGETIVLISFDGIFIVGDNPKLLPFGALSNSK